MKTLHLYCSTFFAGLAVLVLVVPAQAANLVVNGNFTQFTAGGPSSEFGDQYPTVQLTGWSTSGYNFVYAPGAADTTGANGQDGNLQLWGPNNGSNNGLTATDPNGGNYVGADGDFGQAPITQTINGLTVGSPTTLSFYWAGAQQYGFTGPNTEQWQVSLGGQTFSTAVYNNSSEGFSGWQLQTFTFDPTSTSEVLSFFAIGTPAGVPPFSLLADVSIPSASATPEPGSFMLLGTGLAGISGIVRSRLKKSKSIE